MTQASREVLIELLFLSIYLDDHLSLGEDEVLNQALASLGWESEQPREKFIFTAFSAAREAAASPITTEDFLATRIDQIKRDGTEGVALTWLSKIFAADDVTPGEKRFLDQFQARLYP